MEIEVVILEMIRIVSPHPVFVSKNIWDNQQQVSFQTFSHSMNSMLVNLLLYVSSLHGTYKFGQAVCSTEICKIYMSSK